MNRLLLALVVMLSLLLLRDCNAPPQAPVPLVRCPELVPAEGSPPEASLTGHSASISRAVYAPPLPIPVPWLSSLRLQVAARAPRIAACFVGAGHPGQLRWTVSVDRVEGRVFDHELEPMLNTLAISAREHSCVLAALSSPPYHLDAPKDPSTPPRISLVIEF